MNERSDIDFQIDVIGNILNVLKSDTFHNPSLELRQFPGKLRVR